MVDHGKSISGVAGVERIDVRWAGSYVQIDVYPENEPATLPFDLVGLRSFIAGLTDAEEMATALAIENEGRRDD